MPEAKKAPSSPASTVRTTTFPGSERAGADRPSPGTRVGLSASITAARAFSEGLPGTEIARVACACWAPAPLRRSSR